MLDPNAQRKPLRLQGDVHLIEHLEHVSRGMPGREHDCIRCERTPIRKLHTGHSALRTSTLDDDPLEPGLEVELHAHGLESFTQRSDHFG